MREILFRGKRTDSGEWVYGYLVKADGKINHGKCYILPTMADFSYGDNGRRIRIGCFVEVEPFTGGQYTGLTDKNGKKVFEGDIVKTKKYGKIIGHANVNDFDIFVVKYTPCTFRLENKNRGFNLVDDGFNKIEVIGNIHDNPELLEGGTERAD